MYAWLFHCTLSYIYLSTFIFFWWEEEEIYARGRELQRGCGRSLVTRSKTWAIQVWATFSLEEKKKSFFLQPIMSIIFNWQLICCTDFYNLIVLYKTVLIYLFYLFFGTFTFSLSKYKLQGVRKSYKYIIIMFIWLHCSGITILILKNNNEAIVLFFWSWSLAQEQKRELTPLQWHKVAA